MLNIYIFIIRMILLSMKLLRVTGKNNGSTKRRERKNEDQVKMRKSLRLLH